MDNLVPQQDLMEIYDQITREITPQAAGIRLQPGGEGPREEICTVCILFEKGFHMALSVCAEKAMFIRTAQYMMQTEQISRQDIEDVAKEYINVLCGHFASRLFLLTKVPARFSVPAFREGRCPLEGHREDFVLTYTGDGDEHVQLIHYTPLEAAPDPLSRGSAE